MAPGKSTLSKSGRPARSASMNPTPTILAATLSYNPKFALASATFLSAIELLNDLTNFCGIGSLEIQMPRRAAIGMEAPDGWLWLESQFYKYPKSSIEAALQELVDHGIMRCTYIMVTKNKARVRIYVLPDDVGRSMIQRDDPNLRKRLKAVMAMMDTSVESWEGGVPKGELLSKPESGELSLFLMFNAMESPKPDPESPWITDEDTRDLLRSVLAPGNNISGLKTTLYKYQKRSVALMLQKELASERTQDPRLKEVYAPTGEIYYWESGTTEIFQDPRYYEDVKGGILAEEMGTGKTLICLAVILASKHQVSSVPEEYVLPPPLRQSVPSLGDLCVASIWRNAIPWTQYMDMIPENCVKKIRDNQGFYEAPQTSRSRSRRYTYGRSAVERIYLGTGTIIVCPQNLVKQWGEEIDKHIEGAALKFLIIAKSPAEIPCVSDLLGYDVLLISRPCFDAEAREGRDAHGRAEFHGVPPTCRCTYKGSTRIPDCVCFRKEAVYKSPLMRIRWKRLIVDEGHSMASNGVKSESVCVAEKLPVERRWIVTGTPTSELVGIMPGMVMEVELNRGTECRINEALQLDRIGKMVGDFLKQKPWAPMDDRRNTGRANWKRYISKGSKSCVRSIFQRLFIRHRPEDIEEDVALPRLDIKEVWLHPGVYEKLSMNLFLGALAVNAVTSERMDRDYMFHADNKADLKQLTDNLLKRSGFYFPGHSIADVVGAVKISRDYLVKHTQISPEDKELLYQAINAGEMALGMRTWREISIHRDMVYFLSDFPEQLAPVWSFLPGGLYDSNKLFEMDGSQVQNLQKSFNAHASEFDIISKLQLVGNDFYVARQNKFLSQTKTLSGEPKTFSGKPKMKDPHRDIVGSSMSSNSLVPLQLVDKKSLPVTAQKPKKSTGPKLPLKLPLKSALKKSQPVSMLPLDSPLAKARIVGTVSRKLTYLINKILEHHKTEKTLIFLEDRDVAWYIAQALEILGVEHLSYSGSLSPERRATHLSVFQNSEKYRVLLMELNQAAHGLDVSCASRVFFVNPVWRRDIEQQAMKRAHRIGQTKPVYVETLILVGTIEEAMYKRRRAMTAKERDGTKGGLIEDSKMIDIISNLKFLNVEPDDGVGIQQVFIAPQPIFGDGKHGGVYNEIEHVHPSSPTTITTPLPITLTTPLSVQWGSSDTRAKATDPVTEEGDDVPSPDDILFPTSSGPSGKRKLSPVVLSAGPSRPIKSQKRLAFKMDDKEGDDPRPGP